MLKDLKWEKTQLKPKRARLKPWQQILLRAADIIETKGWVQNRFGFDGGPRCAAGAINEAAGNKVYCAPWHEAKCQLKKHVGNPSNIGFWNDRKGRTKKEVIAALRAAAER